MRIYLLLFIMLTTCLSAPYTSPHSGGVEASIKLYTPIPGNQVYRGHNFSVLLEIRNGLDRSVNITVEPSLKPLELVWSNYTSIVLGPGSSTSYTWILHVPQSIVFGRYVLGFNISYIYNSTVHSIYRQAYVDIIPRNITLLTADLTRNASGYYLVVSNPLSDPGQYIVENASINIVGLNITVEPRSILIEKLVASTSYTIPLRIMFNKGSDLGAVSVNITAPDDIHGIAWFNYTFIVVNATAHLHLCIIDDHGNPLPGASVEIDNETYTADVSGCLDLALPIGIHNYTMEYNGHNVSGKIFLYTGYNNHTIVVDLTPPEIILAKQKGYGIQIEAYDPGLNASGIREIAFIQDRHRWTYLVGPAKNVSITLYPPLSTGQVALQIIDSQGNIAEKTIYYEKPKTHNPLMEVIIVFSIVFIILLVLLILSLGRS